MPDSTVSNLRDLLYVRAKHSPDLIGLIIDGKSYSWSWLWENSQRFASVLIEENVKKEDRIIIMVPNSAAFFVAFYGCILCGAIAVPVFPNSGIDRCNQLMKLSGSKNIVIPSDFQVIKRNEFSYWAMENDIRIHMVNESPESNLTCDLPAVLSDDIAYMQYTSGSTDFPKGIPLSHHNLITNIIQMAEAMNVTSDDVFVSWLPVYHDMGLILNTMVPIYTGARLILLEEGLHSIHSWLKAIEQYKGTFISAPDTAYHLCVYGIRRHSDYNIASLRVALNASEPIHLHTCQMFEEAFNLKNVMVSGYGLAEATVAVTMQPPGTLLRIDENNYVSSGKPLNGINVRIDSENNSHSEKSVGEILVKSPALMKGYYNENNNSKSIDIDGYLHTGDIGYIDNNGYLFVLSRKKNIIKQAGHTLYPDDVEQVVKSMEEVRQAAAIGIERLRNGGESLMVFAEIRKYECPPPNICHSIVLKIVQKIYDHFGIRPGRIFLLKPKSLPRTPNGKLQHAILKNMYKNYPEQLNKYIIYPLKN